jgi:hypothetical protein
VDHERGNDEKCNEDSDTGDENLCPRAHELAPRDVHKGISGAATGSGRMKQRRLTLAGRAEFGYFGGVAYGSFESSANVCHVERVDVDCRSATGFGECTRRGGDDGTTGDHCFEWRESETLEQ